jgi:hypothetical protein
MRASHSEAGHGYSLWWEPRQEGVAGGWQHEPTESLRGTLRLTRTGETLRFWYSDNVDANVVRSLRERTGNAAPSPGDGDAANEGFIEIGSAPGYGAAAITSIELWVTVPETTSPVDVTFDNVTVRADRIIDPSAPAASPVGPRGPFGLIAAVCAAVLALAAWLTWRARSRSAK